MKGGKNAMEIIEALVALKAGYKIRRKDWFSKDAYICLNSEGWVVNEFGVYEEITIKNLIPGDTWEIYK